MGGCVSAEKNRNEKQVAGGGGWGESGATYLEPALQPGVS